MLNQTNLNVSVNTADVLNQALGLASGLVGSQLVNGTIIRIPIDAIIDRIVQDQVIPTSVNFTYTVVEGIDQPLGKFPNTLGNVALVDCNSVGLKFRTQMEEVISNIRKTNSQVFRLLDQIAPNIE